MPSIIGTWVGRSLSDPYYPDKPTVTACPASTTAGISLVMCWSMIFRSDGTMTLNDGSQDGGTYTLVGRTLTLNWKLGHIIVPEDPYPTSGTLADNGLLLYIPAYGGNFNNPTPLRTVTETLQKQ